MCFWATHEALVTKAIREVVKGLSLCIVGQRVHKNHRQGDVLGPWDRERGEALRCTQEVISECSTKDLCVSELFPDIREMRCSRTSSRKRSSVKSAQRSTTHQVHRKCHCRGGLVSGGSNQNRERHAVHLPSSTRWTRVPIRNLRITNSLTTTRSTLWTWSERRKTELSSSRLPTDASSASTRIPNNASKGSCTCVTKLKRTRIQQLQLGMRRCPEIRTARLGQENSATLMLWLSEMALCWKKCSASRRHETRIGTRHFVHSRIETAKRKTKICA